MPLPAGSDTLPTREDSLPLRPCGRLEENLSEPPRSLFGDVASARLSDQLTPIRLTEPSRFAVQIESGDTARAIGPGFGSGSDASTPFVSGLNRSRNEGAPSTVSL